MRTMNVDAVLVSFTLEGHQTTYETSGILFNTDMVLLTGTAFLRLVQQEKWISQFVNSSSSKLQLGSHIHNVYFRVYIEPRNSSGHNGSCEQLNSCEGKAVGIWKCPLVGLSAKKLLSDWRVGDVNFENNSWDLSKDDIDLSKELMSIFILLKCEDRGGPKQSKEANNSNDLMGVLLNLLSNLRNASRGQEVEVVSTPFGNKYFINSLSRGVLSNAVGCEKCIILSDARTVSGCEGGPIFLSKGTGNVQERGRLTGMVTCPLTWWRSERVGFTVGISLLPVIKKLVQPEIEISCSLKNTSDSLSPARPKGFNKSFLGIENYPPPLQTKWCPYMLNRCWYELQSYAVERTSGPGNLVTFRDSSLFKFVDENVVLVRSKDSWGSGVILQCEYGIVLTCSHVVKNDKVVSVFHMKNRWLADVTFSSRDDIAFDLAVIKVRDKCGGVLTEAKFAEKPAKLGETVIAAGFPFFSEQDDIHIRPSVVTGCISRVNPYMIQTTCCIQSGFSGGPLFRDGELLGIIVSNTIGSGVLYPHINFIIPSSVFKEPVLKYIKTNDIQSLKDLESPNIQVQSLWKLQTSKL